MKSGEKMSSDKVENIKAIGIKKVPNSEARDYLCVRCEDGFKNLVMK